MKEEYAKILKDKLDDESLAKLEALGNEKLLAFVTDSIQLCRPDSVKVCADAAEDIACIRQLAIEKGEELPLKIEGADGAPARCVAMEEV